MELLTKYALNSSFYFHDISMELLTKYALNSSFLLSRYINETIN